MDESALARYQQRYSTDPLDEAQIDSLSRQLREAKDRRDWPRYAAVARRLGLFVQETADQYVTRLDVRA